MVLVILRVKKWPAELLRFGRSFQGLGLGCLGLLFSLQWRLQAFKGTHPSCLLHPSLGQAYTFKRNLFGTFKGLSQIILVPCYRRVGVQGALEGLEGALRNYICPILHNSWYTGASAKRTHSKRTFSGHVKGPSQSILVYREPLKVLKGPSEIIFVPYYIIVGLQGALEGLEGALPLFIHVP